MAVLQSRLDEIRYLKRQNLEEEAKMVGNMYRDIIRQYGIDCNYYKIKTPYLNVFKKIIDENTLIMHAYGEDVSPDYTISSDMVTYMEVENDIMQLNRYGVIPNMDVNFYFNSMDFACSLAYKLGKLREYPIREQEFVIEVPEVISTYVDIRVMSDIEGNRYDYNIFGEANKSLIQTVYLCSYFETHHNDLEWDQFEKSGLSILDLYEWTDYINGSVYSMSCNWMSDELLSSRAREFETLLVDKDSQLKQYKQSIEAIYGYYLSCRVGYIREWLSLSNFPFDIGYGIPEYYESDILSGKFMTQIGPYNMLSGELSDISEEYTVMCRPYEHGQLSIDIPVNDTIYRSFNHTVETKEYVDQVLFLTYRVNRVRSDEDGKDKFILHGKLHGAILFHDLNAVGKYFDMIHPDVGDIVTIDFPDASNRQQFQITECNDKNLGNDGINPLLHKYVWKCKARRYINSGEDFPEKNEANERLDEKLEFLDDSLEKIAKDEQISNYDEDASDAVYGGYEREESKYDKNTVDKREVTGLEFIDDGSYIDIFQFSDKSSLKTNGYDLFYVDTKGLYYLLTMTEEEYQIGGHNLVAGDLQYIKATDDALVFVNFEGKVQKMAEDEEITQGEIQMCLNSLLDATHDMPNNNENGQFYYKFRECNTVLMSLNDSLYCRFGNKGGKMVKLNVASPES